MRKVVEDAGRLNAKILFLVALVLAIAACVATYLLPNEEQTTEADPTNLNGAIAWAIPTTLQPPAPTTTTTSTPPTTARPRPRRTTPTTQRASRSAGARGSEDTWTALANCESHGNPKAVSDSNPTYYGAFQFSLATWHSVGGPGNPIDHSYEVQLAYAKKLQARSGWGQWPRCAKRLRLI